MNCEQSHQHLDDLLAGASAEAARTALETHLAGCPACRHEWETLTELSRELNALPGEEPSPSLRQKFYSTLEAYRAGLEANAGHPGALVPTPVAVLTPAPLLRGGDGSSPRAAVDQGALTALFALLRTYRFHCGGLATVGTFILLFTLATPSTPEHLAAQISVSPREQMLAWHANRRWFAELLEPAPAPAPERKPAVPPRPRSDRGSEQRRT